MLFANTNIHFIALGTLPTSCATFTVTYTVFGNFVLFTKDNCRQNAELHVYGPSKVHSNKIPICKIFIQQQTHIVVL